MGRVSVMVAFAVVVAVAFGACSSLEPRLDRATVERGVEQSARSEFADVQAVVGKARCPSNRLQRKGDHFECHITIDRQDVVYVVRQLDSHGTVQPTLQSHYLLFSAIDDQALAALRDQGLDRATVACGYAHVWFVSPPVTRDCVVTLSDHTTRTAHVSLAADSGVENVVVAGLSS
jgi:hypothetical protein